VLIPLHIKQIKAVDIYPKMVYSSLISYTIQSPGRLSAQPLPSGVGHEDTPLEGIESEASKGPRFLSGGFLI
jgi:hypothetical protein